MEEKVVGTTFRNIDIDMFDFDDQELPEASYEGWIYPERTNQYDENAKLVEIFLPIGEGQHKVIPIGYLKRDGKLYNKLKSRTRRPLNCKINIKAYSKVNPGMYDSYKVAVD